MTRIGSFWDAVRRRTIGALAVSLLCLATPLDAPAQEAAQEADQEPAQEAVQEAAAPDYRACAEAVDDDALRQVLVEAADRALRQAAADIDYRRVVVSSWLAVRFDAKFANIVDAKIELLREDRAYLERLLDGNIPSRAREMAERTADLVFNSPEFAALQKELQDDLGRRLEPRIADVQAETGSLAADCVRTYMGRRFADSVRQAFTDEAASARIGAGVDGAGVQLGVAISLAGVIAAILAVVFRRLLARVVRSIVQRLAGAIAARLAAFVSVVAGAVILVYELVAGADGVFPIIRAELTSVETRNEMQRALVEDLSTVAPERLAALAPQIAERVFQRWRTFKENHDRLLELAARRPEVQAFLDRQSPERFEAISAAVAQLTAEGGEPAVIRAIETGALAEAASIPSLSRQLEAWVPRGKSLDDLVAWRRVAGERFDAVLDAGVPATLEPEDTSAAELDAIAALDDPRAAGVVAALPKAARTQALDLPPDLMRGLSRRLAPDALGSVFDAFSGVEDPGRRRIYLERIADDPDLAAAIASPRAARAVAASREPQAAFDLLLDPAPLWSPFAFADHLETVILGRAAPELLAHRYGWTLLPAVGLPLLAALGVLRALFGLLGWLLRPFRRRRT
ncbi:MAG: hypothetical protein AAFW46_07920 [Pseudomonadota bacterium]